MCVGVINTLNTMAGPDILLVYMILLLEKSGSNIDPNLGPVIIGYSRIVVSFLIPFFIQKFNPKGSVMTGQIISAMAMVIFGTFSYLHHYRPGYLDTTVFGWVPICLILVQFIMRSGAIQPVMGQLLSEVYPTEIRTQSLCCRQRWRSHSRWQRIVLRFQARNC